MNSTDQPETRDAWEQQLKNLADEVELHANEATPYLDLSTFKLPEVQAASGPLDDHTRRNLLKHLGVVIGSQGTSRVRLEPTRKETLARTLAGAKALVQALALKVSGELAKEEVQAALAASGAEDWRVLRTLKTLEVVAGVRGRSGGIQTPSKTADEFAKAKEEFAVEEELPADAKAREHEAVYYPLAADALRAEDFEPSVTGVRQRGRGEWSTPDVVGYYVRASSALGIAILRVGTVEVKHRLSRSAIAEATAHRRFAHYSYVGVPEPFADLKAELREECVRCGIGLMCFKQNNSVAFQVFIEPVLNRADEELLEELLVSLNSEDGRPLADHVFTLLRSTSGQSLFR
jgi:hypothetical protein